MRILITSGGTKVPIDGVRSITNMSSGTFGSKIAFEALEKGHEVIYLRAIQCKSPFSMTVDYYEQERSSDPLYQELENNAQRFHFNNKLEELYKAFLKYQNRYWERAYVTFESYILALRHCISWGQPDVIVLAAAVSDYGVENYVDGKIRSKENLTIQLKPLPKIISQVKQWAPAAKLVGFKLLVDSTEDQLITAARCSVVNNKCDMVVANDLRDIKNDKHTLMLVKENSVVIVKPNPNDPHYLAKEVVNAIEKL